MLSRDERLRYLERLEEAKSAILSDPEVAAEYEKASQAWDSAISPALTEADQEAIPETAVGPDQAHS